MFLIQMEKPHHLKHKTKISWTKMPVQALKLILVPYSVKNKRNVVNRT